MLERYGFYAGCVYGSPSTVLNNIPFNERDYSSFDYIQATSPTDPTLIYEAGGSDALLNAWIARARALNPAIKLLITYVDAVNGLANHNLITDAGLRAQLVANLVAFMVAKKLDGICLDVEYSVLYPPPTPAQYGVFIHDMRVAIGTGILTAALFNMEASWHNNFPVANEVDLDLVLLMNYNAWDGNGDGIPQSPRGTYQALLKDVQSSVNNALTAGFSRLKLCMGIPFFAVSDFVGHYWTWGQVVSFCNPAHDVDMWYGASYPSVTPPWDLFDGCACYKNRLWFNNIDTVKLKVDFAKASGLIGIMIYEDGADSFTASSLSDAINEVVKETTMANVFAPGAVKSARAPITVLPAGLNCQAELFIGLTETNKAATSGRISFVSTGAAQNITFPITMPSSPGTYNVYIDVLVEGYLLVAFLATDPVIIPSGTVGPPVWS